MIHRIASRACRTSAIIRFGVSKDESLPNEKQKKIQFTVPSFYKLEMFDTLVARNDIRIRAAEEKEGRGRLLILILIDLLIECESLRLPGEAYPRLDIETNN